MGIMVLFDQHQNIVNVNFDLPNQFHLEHHIIRDVLFSFIVLLTAPFVPQVLIATQVVLQIPFRDELIALEIIKGGQQVPHPQQCTKQHNKVLLVLLSDDLWLCQRELLRQVIDHVRISLMVFSLLIRITMVIVRIFAQ